jgi:hypothetical protein
MKALKRTEKKYEMKRGAAALHQRFYIVHLQCRAEKEYVVSSICEKEGLGEDCYVNQCQLNGRS